MEFFDKLGKKATEAYKITADKTGKIAKETKKLVSVEDHSVIGGLGSAISEVLTDKYPKKLVRMGIEDSFGKSGRAEDLMKYYGIDSNSIVEEMDE